MLIIVAVVVIMVNVSLQDAFAVGHLLLVEIAVTIHRELADLPESKHRQNDSGNDDCHANDDADDGDPY